jgi:O-antigen ligase
MQELASSKTVVIEPVVIGDEASRLSSAIFALLCLVPVVSTVLFGAVDNTTWVIITLLWCAIILLWLAEARKAGGLIIDSSKMQLPVLGLLLIGLVQLLPLGGASDVAGVMNALSMDPFSTRFFLVRLVVYLVFLTACLAFINHERRLKKAVILVVVFGSLMAFFGILQRLANPDGIYGMRGTPQSIPFGPFVNQHHFAAFMQMTGGAALGLLFGKRTARDKKILLAIAVVIMGVAVVLTSSRGGLLGFLAVLAFVTILNFLSGRWSGRKEREEISLAGSMQRKVALAAGGIALIAVIFGVVLFIGGNDSLLRGIGAAGGSGDISSGRMHFWPIAIKIFLEHPLIGAGFDAFGSAFSKFDTWNGLLRVEQAHNDYLQILADAGILGFACVAAFIYLLFRKGLATIAAAGNGFRRDAAVGALAGCFGIMIHSFFDFPLRTPSNAFFFLMACAIATVSITSDHAHSPRRRRNSTEP